MRLELVGTDRRAVSAAARCAQRARPTFKSGPTQGGARRIWRAVELAGSRDRARCAVARPPIIRIGSPQSLRADVGEARDGAAGDGDGFGEHPGGARPESAFAVEGAIDDERLKRLTMAGEAEHVILVAFVMAVKTGAGLGREGREVGVGHGEG